MQLTFPELVHETVVLVSLVNILKILFYFLDLHSSKILGTTNHDIDIVGVTIGGILDRMV